MTAIIILENCKLTDIVTVSKKAAGTGGSRLGLKTNDKISINDLMYGLLLVSGNDTAVALAEYAAGSVENFVKMMNQKAKDLNLKDTNFITPHGLDSEEHYTTAFELALITDYALQNNKFAQIVNTKNYIVNINGTPKALSNTNELLGNLNGVNGVKTGFTNEANRCLVTSVKRDSMNIITVVLGADTKKFRTSDSVKLIEYAYSNFKNVPIKDMINNKYKQWEAECENDIVLNKGINKRVDTILEEYDKEFITIKNTEQNDIRIQIENEEYLETPIQKKQIIGKIKLFVNNDEKFVVNILNEEYIKRMNILDFYVRLLTNNWKTMCEI